MTEYEKNSLMLLSQILGGLSLFSSCLPKPQDPELEKALDAWRDTVTKTIQNLVAQTAPKKGGALL